MSTDLSRKLRQNASPPERAMWRILWTFRQQGWHFRRQMRLGPHYVDFACVAAGLVIEVDGNSHALTQAQDAARDEYLAARGMLVLRFSNSDVMTNPDGVFEVVSTALAAVRASSNTPTPSLPARGREDLTRGNALAASGGAA